jgi:hypothetical protein
MDMSMKQVGIEREINLQERGYLSTGGMISESIDKRETVLLGQTNCLTETVNRSESVVITNI